ncbi:MAG: serine/threonine-protein kinase [Phormidesmis sp.]
MNSPLPNLALNLTAKTDFSPLEDVTRFQDAVGNIEPPKRLFRNRFAVIRRLGKGGFSTTYLAQDVSTTPPLPCVIKRLKYKLQPDHSTPSALNQPLLSRSKAALAAERIQRRFQQETHAMARLGRHSQIPRLLEHFTDDGQFYLVQEHILGHTLSQEISRSGPQNKQQNEQQSEQQVKQFLREMIPIIRYIHRQNLLHLDIKPANIMRRQADQKLVLIDFGAVRRYSAEVSPETLSNNPFGSLSKKAGRGCGTIGFSPSEQLAGRPTFASDIYALGVTCLCLLTQISPLALATSWQGQNLRWQESVDVSDHFARVLSKMLYFEADRRFQNTHELERAMNLENHYPDLKTCLTTEALTDQTFSGPFSDPFSGPAACQIAHHNKVDNQSQAQRQADSIRRWQQRRRQFKSFAPS